MNFKRQPRAEGRKERLTMNDVITTNQIRSLRKKAAMQGFGISKGRDAYGCVGFMIYDLNTNVVEAGYCPEYSMSYEDVETFLNSDS